MSSYWQRRPLIIRQAVPGFASPLSADELAGLACGDAPSRIVLERGVARPWELVRRVHAEARAASLSTNALSVAAVFRSLLHAQRRGPFQEADFAALPETHWTLLVNGVDRAVPAVADELLSLFAFLPRCSFAACVRESSVRALLCV
jgi:50S ribosomal protein L16 3-hydroxylase